MLAVNGRSLAGSSHADAIASFKSIKQGQVNLTIGRRKRRKTSSSQNSYKTPSESGAPSSPSAAQIDGTTAAQPLQSVAMATNQPVAMATTQPVAMATNQPVAMATTQSVAMATNQSAAVGGLNSCLEQKRTLLKV